MSQPVALNDQQSQTLLSRLKAIIGEQVVSQQAMQIQIESLQAENAAAKAELVAALGQASSVGAERA